MNTPYVIHNQWQKREEKPSQTEINLINEGGFGNLKEWMESRKSRYSSEADFGSSKHDFRGRLYPTNSDSITYNRDKESLVQATSSPSYFGGLWSLACCKKDMRRSSKFENLFREVDEGHYKPEEPVFVFTVSSKQGDKYQGESKQWLASVAMVTDGFYEMEKYGEHLVENYQGEALENRITCRGDSDHIGAKKGDCHVKIDGEEVEKAKPSPNHDHVKENPPCGEDDDHGYKEDWKPDHLKVVSRPGFWISWREPMFETKETIHWTYPSDPDNNIRKGIKLHSYQSTGTDGIKDWLNEVN